MKKASLTSSPNGLTPLIGGSVRLRQEMNP